MPRPQPLGNFEVLGFRRHGFEATRTPAPASLALGGRVPTLLQTNGTLPVTGLPFSESYEAGTRGNWQTNVGMTFTQTEAYVGSWSSMITAVQGVGSDKYLEYNFGDHPSIGGVAVGTRDLWFRFAHKWGNGWSDGSYQNLQKLCLLNLHNPASGQRRHQLTFNMWTPTTEYFCEFLRINEQGSFNGASTPNVNLGLLRVFGIWVEFVFRVKMNTLGASDGVLQIWSKAQGETVYTQRVNRSNINYRDSNDFSPNRLIQSNYQPETVLSGNRYWDYWLLTETPIDITPPTVPANVSATSQSQTTLRVSWSASTDAVGVAGYRVFRATAAGGPFSQLGSDLASNVLSLDDTSLAAGQTRYYQVYAFDAAGNVSAASATASGTTQASSGGFVPTHYVTPTATGAGNGSQASPWTIQQACALAQPGHRVEFAPGDYIGVNTNSTFGACFSISAQGTEANPIIFFARNYAALNTTGRSVLRHNGTTQGQGCPLIGASTGHHWYGFYINEDQAPTHADTGPVVCSGRYNRFSYFRVNRGSAMWPEPSDNNHAAFRFEGQEGARFNVVSDCWIENYSAGSNGTQFRPMQAIMMFSKNINEGAIPAGLLTVENCYFDNCYRGLTVKGAGSSRPVHGGIIYRKNLLRASNVLEGGANFTGSVQLMDTSGELGRNQIYQNIQVGGGFFMRCFVQASYPIRDVDVMNNTAVAMVQNNEGDGLQTTSGNAAATGSGWRVHNNIKIGAARFCLYRYDNANNALQSRSHNFGRGHSAWALEPENPARASLQTLAQWVASTIYDDNSSEADPLLVSSTWGSADLGKLQTASPCRNAGVDLLNLLGGGTAGAINVGAYITSDMSDVIGIRPLS